LANARSSTFQPGRAGVAQQPSIFSSEVVPVRTRLINPR
jgi:hypothetical protein